MKHFSSLGRGLAALLLLGGAPAAAQAQTGGIAIGAAVAPDVSAALDISSSAKGVLLPRLTAAQVAAIASPATGLLVFQTDGTPGFYYNLGSAAFPRWRLLGAGDNLGSHTATQALNVQDNALVGTGASLGSAIGVGIRADGGLNLGQNSTGHNLLLGYQAGRSLAPDAIDSTGFFNQFSGYQSGQATIAGSANLFSGFQSGYHNTGTGNQFAGFRSGYANTTGEGNLFSGFHSGYSNTTGFANHFDGVRSGFANTTGYNNQYQGFNAGANSTTGTENLFVGYGSGLFNVGGSSNTALGANSGPDFNSPALTNATALGANVALTQSNTVVLGSQASVGIGTSAPGEKLQVVGTIYSSAGGFRFPDNTVQTTAVVPAGFVQNTTTPQAGSSFNVSGNGTVGGHLLRSVRLCPVNTAAYALTADDLAFDQFKLADGATAAVLTLPPGGTGQVPGQELTIYSVAASGVVINAANTDNATAIALAASGTSGPHAVRFVWDGTWIRVQ